MNNTRRRSQFTVRQLKSEDEIAACLTLDRGYETDHVWQMDVREDGDDMGIRFRVVRLPRVMRVEYPRDDDELIRSWKGHDCFLVAEADDVLLGYINMRIDANRTWGLIRDLVVGMPFRRRRVGSALLEQAIRWALLRDVHHLTLEMQTKNYPGMKFAQRKGFVFCGFNDHYYANRDIAVFFDRDIP